MAREAGFYYVRQLGVSNWTPAMWTGDKYGGFWFVCADDKPRTAEDFTEIGERIPSPDERPAHADAALAEATEPRCPFCGHDPFHYVDNGVGMEAVAVTCCSLGDAYFRGMRQDPETVTLDWAEFRDIGNRLAAYATRAPERERAAAEGWQPIETAPKDGTRIILAWGDSSRVGFWLDNSRTQWPWAGWRVPSMEAEPGGKPTHWQPLPMPPAAEREEDGHG